MSSLNTVVELPQTPLYGRPHVESEASVGHALDYLQWRDENPIEVWSIGTQFCMGRNVLSLAYVISDCLCQLAGNK